MSPRPGGPAAKDGDRYEYERAVDCMLNVLDGAGRSIEFEPIEGGDGIEFRVRLPDGSPELHQVKRQLSDGHWTIAVLASHGILAAFYGHLQADRSCRCVFTSEISAGELRELVRRAHEATNAEQFIKTSVAALTVGAPWRRLLAAWGDPPVPDGFQALRRIHVDTIDEDWLHRSNELRCSQLLAGAQPPTMVDALIGIAARSRNEPLDAAELLRRLEPHGIRGRALHLGELRSARAQAADYARSVDQTRLTDVTLPRLQAAEIAEQLTTQDPSTRGVLLTGAAGTGKSTVTRQVVEALESREIPVLAIRLDRVEPTRTTADLGAQMGLDASPVAELAHLAGQGRSVLVIDQLDSVSLVSGRRAQFFDVVSALLDEVAALTNVRALVVCRDFDVNQDPRLSGLAGDEGLARVPLRPLTSAEVVQALSAVGVSAEGLTESQIELLTTPLLLGLFARVAARPGARGATSPQQLLRHMWDEAAEVTAAVGDAEAWMAVAAALADRMSADRTLTAPAAVVDQWPAAVDALVDASVLVWAGDERLAFVHEAFFDYVYARSFVRRGQRLIGMLLREGQHLFRRAQVRQILEYQRQANPMAYQRDLQDVLGDDRVRLHLKDAALAQLGSRPDPTDDELGVLEPLLFDAALPLRRLAWRAASGGGWALLLDRTDRLRQWLASGDDAVIDATTVVLRGRHDLLGGRIAALLEPYIDDPAPWPDRIAGVLWWGELYHDRALFDLYLALLDRGVLDDGQPARHVWMTVSSLPEHEPCWAAEFIARWLRRRVELAARNGQRDPFRDLSREDGPDDSYVRETADGAPNAYVNDVLPLVLDIAAANLTRDSWQPQRDSVWLRRDLDPSQPEEFVLSGLEVALARLAADAPHAFARASTRLQSSELELAQYLLYGAWRHNMVFADEAARRLAEGPERWRASLGVSDYWRTHELIAAIAPHCARAALHELERALLRYDPPEPDDELRATLRDVVQFELLSALPGDRRSGPTQIRLAELRERFGEDEPSYSPGFVSGFVGPPRPEAELMALDDDAWLAVIAEFPDDRRTVDEFLRGGATELARVLRQAAEREPDRFARLGLRLPDDTQPVYFDELLLALQQCDHDPDPAAVIAYCERCHALPGRPCGRWITGPIARLADRDLPLEALDLVAWYATNDPDPPTRTGPTDSGLTVFERGINSVRGAAARSVARLLWARPERLGALQSAIVALARDQAMAVRACAVECLVAMLRTDEPLAFSLFLELIDGDDTLLAGPEIQRFTGYALQRDFERFAPVVGRMLDAREEQIRATGARLAAIAALDQPAAAPLLERTLVGDAVLRRNVAGVYAHNLTGSHRTACEAGLREFFDDPDPSVREQAAECFRLLEDAELADHLSLVSDFLRSGGFADGADKIILAFQHTVLPLPNETLDLCERWLRLLSEEPDSEVGNQAIDVSELAIRAYTQAQSEATLERALDVIDALVASDAYGVMRAVQAAEADR